MKILVTGAAGFLAAKLVSELAKEHQLRLSDFRDMETRHEFVKCDILDRRKLVEVTKGMDLILHTAALGGKSVDEFATVHPKDRYLLDGRYFDVNVTGTFNLLRAAQHNKVPKAILITSEAAMGMPEAEIINERTPEKPGAGGEAWCVYGLTKYLDERIGEYFSRIQGMKIICLRMAGMSEKHISEMGSELLSQQAVTREDMVRAAILAVKGIQREEITFEIILLKNRTDFTQEDLPKLKSNPYEVIERYYPGATKLIEEYGIEVPKFHSLYDVSKAERVLGWKPEFGFKEFYENLKAGKYAKDEVFE